MLIDTYFTNLNLNSQINEIKSEFKIRGRSLVKIRLHFFLHPLDILHIHRVFLHHFQRFLIKLVTIISIADSQMEVSDMAGLLDGSEEETSEPKFFFNLF